MSWDHGHGATNRGRKADWRKTEMMVIFGTRSYSVNPPPHPQLSLQNMGLVKASLKRHAREVKYSIVTSNTRSQWTCETAAQPTHGVEPVCLTHCTYGHTEEWHCYAEGATTQVSEQGQTPLD